MLVFPQFYRNVEDGCPEGSFMAGFAVSKSHFFFFKLIIIREF